MPRKPTRRALPPWEFDVSQFAIHEISALKAVAFSNPVAFKALEKLTGVDRLSFVAGGEEGRRTTDFAEGKRWVGTVLRTVRDMTMPTTKQPNDDPHAVPKGPPPPGPGDD